MITLFLKLIFGAMKPGQVEHRRIFNKYDPRKNMTFLAISGPLDATRLAGAMEVLRGKIDKTDHDIWAEMLRQCRQYGWYRPRVVWLDVGHGKEEVLTFMSLHEPGERYYHSPKSTGPTKEEIAKWEREYYGDRDEEFVKEGTA